MSNQNGKEKKEEHKETFIKMKEKVANINPFKLILIISNLQTDILERLDQLN